MTILSPATTQTFVTGTLFGLHPETVYPAGGPDAQGSANFNDSDFGPLGVGVGASTGTATTSLGNPGVAPFASAGVTVVNNGASSPIAVALVNYQFEVTGQNGATAGVDVVASGSVSATSGYDDGFADALFQVYYRVDGRIHFLVNDEANVSCLQTNLSAPGYCTFDMPNFTVDGEIQAPTNTAIFVNVKATASGSEFRGSPYANFGDGPVFQEIFLAAVDPTFTLDPGDQPGLSLQFSDGVIQPTPGGASGAPEPSAWALLVGGFGLLGATLRARRSPARTVL
ncbi:MAG: PEP-CTERM sorting domain-containing protein [Phenylobacterium sp.]